MSDESTKGSKKSLDATDITTGRTGRRDAMRLIGAAGAFLTATGAITASAQEAQPLCSDSDPYDPGGYGRHCGGGGYGCSDSDPYDPGGRGRHCGRSCSDSDPYDPAGHGRHC